MALRTITLQLPESIYIRLKQAAQAMQQSIDEVLLRVVQVGSPPSWEDAPAEYQADLAALDRLDDNSLWRIARSHQASADYIQYQELLDKNSNKTISETERSTLVALRDKADRFMLRKAHAAALLRWRGHQTPPADKLR